MSILNVEKIQPIGSGSTVSVVAGYLESPSIKGSDANYTGVVTATSFDGNLNATQLSSGTVPTARLGSGTANNTTFLRGDSTFATVTGTTINNNANNRLITGSGTANTLEGEANLTFDGTTLISTTEIQVQGGSGDTEFKLHRTNTAGSNGNSFGNIRFTDSSNNEVAGIRGCRQSAVDDAYLQFLTRPTGGSITERIRIDSTGNTWNTGNVGIQTGDITRTSLVGAGASFIGAYIGDGYIGFNTQLGRSSGYFIPSHINALMAGPVTLNSTMTLDGTWVIV